MRVSVIILNWNGTRYLDRCLESINSQTVAPFEVILVDNGSDDGSEMILDRFESPGKKMLKLGTNTGFARGMNAGISVATGDILVLLNLDVVLDDEFIAECTHRFELDPGLAMLGGTEYAWENFVLTDHVVSMGGFFLKRRIQGVTNLRTSDGYCFGPHGSFPCVRREALVQANAAWGFYYDPKFGTGWEDMDLWYRLHLLGWSCFYSSKLKAWHVGSASAEGKKRLIDKDLVYQRRIFRNRWYMMVKNLLGMNLLIELPFVIAAEVAIVPFFAMVSPRSLGAMAGAISEVIENIGSLMRDRRIAKKARKVNWARLDSVFRGF